MVTRSTPQHSKKRVAVFGSFHRGYNILSALLSDPEMMRNIEIVGVATDDPSKSYVSPHKRMWKYGEHTDEEEHMVENLARRHNIPVYKGRVKTQEFYDLLQKDWKPDIIYMGTFGQKLDNTIINTPSMGCFNAHPSDGETWPSCVGPDPFEQMFKDKKQYCAITLHVTNDKFDDGKFICMSPRIDVPYDVMDAENMSPGERVLHMHRVTSPYAGQLVNTHLRGELGMQLSRPKSRFQNQADARIELP